MIVLFTVSVVSFLDKWNINVYEIWNLMILMKMPQGDLWIYGIHIYMMSRWHEKMVLRWWLRSTTVSYGQPKIEIAYEEILFHSIEAVWKLIAREEWLGCQHDASPMFDILRSTPVWAQYILFSDFYDIKYMYILCFKNLYIL